MLSRKRVLCGAYPAYSHTVTVLKLALTLRAAGHTCAVISSSEAMDRLVERYDIPVVGERKRVRPPEPYVSPAIRAVLDSYGPDITICDWSDELWWALLAWRPACRISILRCALLPGYVHRNPLLPGVYPFEHPLYVERANARLSALSLAPVADLRELFKAEVVAIPSVPAVDPLPNGIAASYPDSSVVYTGPLLLAAGPAVPDSVIEWVEERRREGLPVMLVTLGTIWGAGVYAALANCLARTELAVILVVPFEYLRCRLASQGGSRLRVIGITDLRALVELADVVLHHCGHGTLLTVLRADKPSLMIPSGSSETQDSALRLEELGCGRYLDYPFFRNGFNPDALTAAARSVLVDRDIQKSVAAIGGIVREYENSGPDTLLQTVSNRFT